MSGAGALRAVWSFWSRPFAQRRSSWVSEKHHLLAWILSLETARRHYPNTALYTDDDGARMLIDGLRLPFEHVSTALNGLRDADREWWVLGKLHTYRLQTQPFVHIDCDVFLWNALPDAVRTADVFAQNPESFPFTGESWYRPLHYDARVRAEKGWLPQEWRWYVAHKGAEALCCGVVGGQRVDFLNRFAAQALRLLTHPDNLGIWARMRERGGDAVLFEQYFLAACIAYHQQLAHSPFANLTAHHVFASVREVRERARERGYTHLLGHSKRDPDVTRRLEQRVERDYPEHYENCQRYLRFAA